jgi:hypothetical protein
MTEAIKKDDYARLHWAYHEDTDLAMIADQLDEDHGAGWLVWLYWPRMVARAKQAKSFGWFETTPRKLAASLHDPIDGSWQARRTMWELFTAQDIIRLRQEVVESASLKLDVLLVEYEKWQSLSNAEHSRLRRERAKFEAGEAVHWTVRHWSDFAYSPLPENSRDNETGCSDTDSVSRPPEIVSHPPEKVGRDRTLDETRQDEGPVVRTREGLAEQVAPPTTEAAALEQAIAIFLDCSKGGIDESMWRSQLEQHRTRHLGAPIERYVDAAMQMRAKALDSGRPFTMSSGWMWFTKAWTSLARDEHATPKRNAAQPAPPSAVETGELVRIERTIGRDLNADEEAALIAGTVSVDEFLAGAA